MNGIIKSKAVRIILGFLISGIFIYIAFTKVSAPRVFAAMRSANALYLCLSVFVMVANFILRSVRWKILLEGKTSGRIRLIEYFMAISAGQMVNAFVPLRAGDFAQAFFLTGRTGESPGLALSTVALKRTVDLLAVAAIVVASSFLVLLPGVLSRGRLYVSVAFICLVIYLLFAFKRKLFGLAGCLIKDEKLRGRAESFADRFCDGLELLKDTGKLWSTIILTALLWCGYSLGIFLCMKAFGIAITYPQSIAAMGFTGIGALVPLSVAQIGVWEVASVLALSIFAVGKELALSYAIVYHFISLVTVTGMGVFSLFKSGMSVSMLRKPESQ